MFVFTFILLKFTFTYKNIIICKKLESQNFKVSYYLHRSCFQKNVNSVTLVKARKLIFICFVFLRDLPTQKVRLSLTLSSGQQMHPNVHFNSYFKQKYNYQTLTRLESLVSITMKYFLKMKANLY